MEIRHGRMTREEGIKLVNKYDHVVPRTLNTYLRFLGISEKEFYDAVEPMRDLNIWQKNPDGTWETTDSVANHLNDPEVENARVRQVNDRTFSKRNEYLYYNPFKKKARIKNKSASEEFIIL